MSSFEIFIPRWHILLWGAAAAKEGARVQDSTQPRNPCYILKKFHDQRCVKYLWCIEEMEYEYEDTQSWLIFSSADLFQKCFPHQNVLQEWRSSVLGGFREKDPVCDSEAAATGANLDNVTIRVVQADCSGGKDFAEKKHWETRDMRAADANGYVLTGSRGEDRCLTPLLCCRRSQSTETLEFIIAVSTAQVSVDNTLSIFILCV